ncbi:type I pullulanase [Lactovum odontotermitis]
MNWEEFDKKYGYSGELGAIYRPSQTIFRVWAPACEQTGVSKLELVSYGKSTSPEADPAEIFPMSLGKKEAAEQHLKNKIAVWELTLKGDQAGLVYTYQITYADGHKAETQDPYSIATIVNGSRSVVVQMAAEKSGDALWRLDSPTYAIIEEVHTRDFSISATSGVSEKWRGKFLGLVEEGTVNEYGDATCFDYLQEAYGVNVIQLMPVFDFASVDETRNDGYNWGYDPQNYNVPEGSYSTDPTDPLCRIKELKEVIQKMHKESFNVVMDVVYNHVFDREQSSFEKLVPGYYFRDSTATGCGNDTASEREMFSKFIVDSVTFWAEKYGFDGFRFDLMGCLDVATMNAVRAALDKIDRRILIYGEGWDLPTALPFLKKAMQKNLGRMPRIGAFNDAIRNAIKGIEFEKTVPGFVDGPEMCVNSAASKRAPGNQLLSALKGSRYFFHKISAPEQMINYVEAHDNLNLNDQLWKNHPEDSREQHSRRVEIATALNLLAIGIPFMEIGQEFERSKLVNDDWAAAENSYKAGDAVNAIDWRLVTEHKATSDFVKAAIKFRSYNSEFCLNNFKEVKVQLVESKPGILIYSLGLRTEKYTIAVNLSGRPVTVRGTIWLRLTNLISEHTADALSWENHELPDMSFSVFAGGINHVMD